MAYIIACLMAGLSFLVNKACMRYVGPLTVISVGPLVEETSKTLFAYYLGTSILGVHVLFGGIEAVYDWYQSSRYCLAAGLMSIIGHGLFGAATITVMALTGSVWLGLTSGLALHLVWNVTIVRLLARKN